MRHWNIPIFDAELKEEENLEGDNEEEDLRRVE